MADLLDRRIVSRASAYTGGYSRREILKMAAVGGPGLLLLHCGPAVPPALADSGPEAGGHEPGSPPYDGEKHYWGYAVDTTRCIGCNACMRACRVENDVPKGCFRTWVERYMVDADGEVHVDVAASDDHVFEERDIKASKAFFVPKLCNHCEKSVCSQVCPVGASYTTKDGVVLVDKGHCIGCGYCVQACPYGTRFISPVTHTADKCTLCYHRITRGMEPACVAACPRGARIFGDLKNPTGRLSVILRQQRYRLLKPEMATHPKCYYIGLDREVV